MILATGCRSSALETHCSLRYHKQGGIATTVSATSSDVHVVGLWLTWCTRRKGRAQHGRMTLVEECHRLLRYRTNHDSANGRFTGLIRIAPVATLGTALESTLRDKRECQRSTNNGLSYQMGETAPARKRSVDVTCQTGTPTENQIRWTGGARGGGATNPNIKV